MEKNIEGKNTGGDTLLIDFSSPVSKRMLHTPLIPVPVTADQGSLSPLNANPFDIVVKQTIQENIVENDPFECASKAALDLVNSTQNQSLESQQNVEPKILINGVNKALSDEKNSINTENKTFTVENQNSSGTKCLVENNERDYVLGISAINNEETLFENKASLLGKQADSGLSQVSGDFSTEEGIKALVAKRVNKCIQKVLTNNTVKSKSDKTKENDNSGKKYFNRKSASFTTNVVSDKVCNRLNKSCTEPCSANDSCNELNQNLKTPESSIGSCDATPLSFLSGEGSKQDDSAFLTSEKDEVFQEANKLARTFSKIAESFSKNKDEVDDNADDLLTCKPQWLYADSSEDEEDKLRNDPALNIRVSLTNSMTQEQPDSEALSAFKTKYRRSFSNIQSNDMQNENSMKRSRSIGSKPLIAPVMPIVSSAHIMLEKQDANPVKLKKNPLGESRKGPLRAVMPVQSMAKGSLTAGVQPIRNRDKSPIRKRNASHIMISPIKDTSQLSMHPVASSTPNKCSTPVSHTVIPIAVPTNKRHSLEGVTESRKSRATTTEAGSRQRSSSTTSIPTPVSLQAKALGPRSTSNLHRNSAKVTDNQNKESSKPHIKSTKGNFNSKALNEVKPVIGRPSRVRSAVNAISNVITGKHKNVASRDKENRFPA